MENHGNLVRFNVRFSAVFIGKNWCFLRVKMIHFGGLIFDGSLLLPLSPLFFPQTPIISPLTPTIALRQIISYYRYTLFIYYYKLL